MAEIICWVLLFLYDIAILLWALFVSILILSTFWSIPDLLIPLLSTLLHLFSFSAVLFLSDIFELTFLTAPNTNPGFQTSLFFFTFRNFRVVRERCRKYSEFWVLSRLPSFLANENVIFNYISHWRVKLARELQDAKFQ